MVNDSGLSRAEIALELTTKFAGNLKLNSKTHDEYNEELTDRVAKFYSAMYDAVDEKISKR